MGGGTPESLVTSLLEVRDLCRNVSLSCGCRSIRLREKQREAHEILLASGASGLQWLPREQLVR
jgi:hypothetical protein